MTSKILKKYRDESAQILELPYLPSTIPLRESDKLKQPISKNFDLRTNNSSLPFYQPEKDQSLKGFFSKTTVKKHLEHLPPPRTATKTSRSLKSRTNFVQNSPNKEIKDENIVSKESFMKYLEEVRQKIKSNYT